MCQGVNVEGLEAYSRVLKYLCLETSALAAFAKKEESEGLKHLAQALEISRVMDGATWLLAGPKVSADLYNRALLVNIEVNHVQKLIRRRKLLPPNSAIVSDSWPWLIKVFTLGKFEVLCEDQIVQSNRKAQHKPLELLKCLCAFGGYSVNQDLLIEALWPEAEGDAGEQVFRTTLHRLRNLLRYEQAIQQKDRHLSLNSNYVWVDCLAFSHAARHPNIHDRHFLQHAMNYYLGSFLNGETSSWAIAFRNQLRINYSRIIERYAALLEQENDWSSVIECYQKAIETEPLIEVFYNNLIKIYLNFDRHNEARIIYQHCKQVFLTRLGTQPSLALQSLYHQIMNIH